MRKNFILNALQRSCLNQSLGIDGHAETFVELYGQFDGGNGGEADIAQNGGYAEVLRPDDVRHHFVKFHLQKVHRNVAFGYGFSRFLLGFGQSFLVDFLVLVEWDGLNLHRDGRHHVRRFLVQDEVVHRFDVNLLICHDIGCDELDTAFLVKSLHSGVFNAWELADNAFHLLEFDAETAYLDLPVFASHELDVAVGEIAHDVAGAIDMAVLLTAVKWIGDIDLSGFLGTVEVAPAHLRTSSPQLARRTYRQTATRLINNVKLNIVQGRTNGNVFQPLIYIISGDTDSTLRWTIDIEKGVIRWWSECCQLLAARKQITKTVILHRRGELVGHLCGHESVGNLLAFKILV